MYGDDTVDMGMSGGPMMEGTWYNPQTGDSFTVKDTYFEGDQMYVIAMDGRRYNGDMISSYVQTDGPLPPKPAIDPNQPKMNKGELFQGVDKDMQDEINGLIGGAQPAADPLNQVIGGEKASQKQIQEAIQPVDEDTLLLKRLLDRVEMPKVTCSVKWSKFPSKQLEMLEMLGVPEEKVSDYLVNKLSIEDIYHQVGQSLIRSLKETKEKEDKKK